MTAVPNRAIDRPQPVLEVRDLTVDFATEDGVVHAVRGVNYSLMPREVLGIVGESGSGKSVSVLAIMGLLPRSARVRGSVLFRGTDLLKLHRKEVNEYRGEEIAMIFQDPMTSLNPVHRVGDQLAEAIRAHRKLGKREAVSQAIDMLDKVGIPNARQRARDYPHEFSGGMRQRAMIALALCNDPDVIIADEPTTALDVTIQAQILELLVRLKDEFDTAVILITHDLGVVASMAERVLVMYAGRPVEYGTVDQIYYHPRMPYTLGLLGSLPRLDDESANRLVPIPGAPPSLINLPPGCPFQPRCPMAREMCQDVEPALIRTRDAGHLAACHYSAELEGDVAPEEVFAITAEDAQEVVELVEDV